MDSKKKTYELLSKYNTKSRSKIKILKSIIFHQTQKHPHPVKKEKIKLQNCSPSYLVSLSLCAHLKHSTYTFSPLCEGSNVIPYKNISSRSHQNYSI